MYHGFARSAGLDYWESLGYTFAGSALWEIAGENTPPSSNDQVASGIGGTFLGEALFRMSNLVLEHDGMPRFWRELGAAVISPSTGFNRLAFGDRFDGVFSTATARSTTAACSSATARHAEDAATSTTESSATRLQADFSIDYGLPGKPAIVHSGRSTTSTSRRRPRARTGSRT